MAIGAVDVPLEYETNDGRVVDNRYFVYISQSNRNRNNPYGYWDKVTVAFNYIAEVSLFEENMGNYWV